VNFRSAYKAYQYGQSIVGLETQGTRALQTLQSIQAQLNDLLSQVELDSDLTVEDRNAGGTEVSAVITDLNAQIKSFADSF
jgi:hypothetical protein